MKAGRRRPDTSDMRSPSAASTVLRRLRWLLLPVVLVFSLSGFAWPYLYRTPGQAPLQWSCGVHDVYLRGFGAEWRPLFESKLLELTTATPGQVWRLAPGEPPANAPFVIEYKRAAGTYRGETSHTIDATRFRTGRITINASHVRWPGAIATGATVMHELAHLAGLDHRDDDPESATSRRPRHGIGPWLGWLSHDDRAALAQLGCAR